MQLLRTALATLTLTFAIAAEKSSFSGIFPHLAHTNREKEVGIGAVVPWAGSLWTNTYGPHLPHGSTDKLRQIDTNWNLTFRPESVGGTPANRMIHPESNQLFIGHHVIDALGNVRTIDPKTSMPGRITANARHLTHPSEKIYHVTMENGLYEVDVDTLQVTPIIKDPINISKTHLPGYHAKGAYTSNGRLVIANNGEPNQTFPSGCLASWNGNDWTIIARNQFTEVSGPGGLSGNNPEDDRLWATGWDNSSVRLFLLQNGKWHKFRLPKSSYTHDVAHGWNTEWPRIREIEPGKFLGHMHGLFFEFPKTFSARNYGGIHPIGTYTKMPVDYAMFNGKLIIGKDDASKFDNDFVKQAQSNLWIGDYDELQKWGPKSGFGGLFINESFDTTHNTEPFFIGGFETGTLHLRQKDNYAARIQIQVDKNGDGDWQPWQTVTIPADTGYLPVSLDGLTDTQWLRIHTVDALHNATAYLHLTSAYPNQKTHPKFAPLADITKPAPPTATLQLPKGIDMKLAVFSRHDHHLLDGELTARKSRISPDLAQTRKAIAIKPDPRVGADQTSAYIDFIDATGKQTRLRLPKGKPAFDATIGKIRHIREIVTERTHMNLHGTFYELPRPKPGHFINFWQMKPIASHNKHIHDFASWRGMLTLSGAAEMAENSVLVGDTHLWLGEIDDLWKLGKPTGTGGPWRKTKVKQGQSSDPYLMLGYDKKSIEITNHGGTPTRFGIDIDYLGTGDFARYQTPEIAPSETFHHTFPPSFAAHWIRIVAGKDTTATAQLHYQ